MLLKHIQYESCFIDLIPKNTVVKKDLKMNARWENNVHLKKTQLIDTTHVSDDVILESDPQTIITFLLYFNYYRSCHLGSVWLESR